MHDVIRSTAEGRGVRQEWRGRSENGCGQAELIEVAGENKLETAALGPPTHNPGVDSDGVTRTIAQ